MKTIIKNISIALVLLTLLGGSIYAADVTPMEVELNCDTDSDNEHQTMVKLLGSDGPPLIVPKGRACASGIITNILSVYDVFGAEEIEGGIPLHNCTGVFLNKVFGDNGYIAKMQNEVLGFNDLPVLLEELVEELKLINYLDIPKLLELIACKIGTQLEKLLQDIHLNDKAQPFAVDFDKLADLKSMISFVRELEGKLPLELQQLISKKLLNSDKGKFAISDVSCAALPQHISSDNRYFARIEGNLAHMYDMNNFHEPIYTIEQEHEIHQLQFLGESRYLGIVLHRKGKPGSQFRLYDLKNPKNTVFSCNVKRRNNITITLNGHYLTVMDRIFDLRYPQKSAHLVLHGAYGKIFSPNLKFVFIKQNRNGMTIASVYNLATKKQSFALYTTMSSTAIFSYHSRYVRIETLRGSYVYKFTDNGLKAQYVTDRSEINNIQLIERKPQHPRGGQLTSKAPRSIKHAHLSISQALFLYLLATEPKARDTLFFSEELNNIWGSFGYECKIFLRNKFGETVRFPDFEGQACVASAMHTAENNGDEASDDAARSKGTKRPAERKPDEEAADEDVPGRKRRKLNKKQ